jgi:hypothetical protein
MHVKYEQMYVANYIIALVIINNFDMNVKHVQKSGLNDIIPLVIYHFKTFHYRTKKNNPLTDNLKISSLPRYRVLNSESFRNHHILYTTI